MKKISLLALLFLMFLMSAAYAIPFIKVGPKVGYGKLLPLDLPGSIKSSDETVTAIGAGAMFSLLMVQLEANVLYASSDFSTSSVISSLTATEVKFKNNFSTINVPVIARFNFSPIPLLNLALGAGYEQRVLVSAESASKDVSSSMNNTASYLPISLNIGGDIPMLFNVSLELRYSHQLTSWYKDSANKTTYDDFMAFASIYF